MSAVPISRRLWLLLRFLFLFFGWFGVFGFRIFGVFCDCCLFCCLFVINKNRIKDNLTYRTLKEQYTTNTRRTSTTTKHRNRCVRVVCCPLAFLVLTSNKLKHGRQRQHKQHYDWENYGTHSRYSTWYPLGLGEFRETTPTTQQNFRFVVGDGIQVHEWVQSTHSRYSTWCPISLGNSDHPRPSLNRTLGSYGGDRIQFRVQINYSHRSTWYPLGLGNSEHPPSLLNTISTRNGELRAPTPVTQHSIH